MDYNSCKCNIITSQQGLIPLNLINTNAVVVHEVVWSWNCKKKTTTWNDHEDKW